MNTTRDRIVDDYLARTYAALAGLPAERRREIVENIADHIDAACADVDPGDEAALRNVLDRIGDPEQIAADAQGDDAPLGRGRLEMAAIVLLLVGGFVFAAGWLVGVLLLWLSDRWRLRDKVIGTLFIPGGLALPVFLLGVGGIGTSSSGEICTSLASTSSGGSAVTTAQHCTSYGGTPVWHIVAGVVVLVALTAAAIAAAVHLARRSR